MRYIKLRQFSHKIINSILSRPILIKTSLFSKYVAGFGTADRVSGFLVVLTAVEKLLETIGFLIHYKHISTYEQEELQHCLVYPILLIW